MLGAMARPADSVTAERLSLVLLFAVAGILRVHGAWAAPPLSGFDGPFHAANIGILLFEGRLPLPHEGWSTFHPPLYYALSAGLWALLPDDWSAHPVLFTLRLLNVAASLALGAAVLCAARMVLPGRPLAAFTATALALFLPMEIGPSFLLGNEMFGAALSAWSVVALLACLRPGASWRASVALGVVLGLAVLTKFNTASVALAAAAALLVHDLWRRGASPGALSRTATVAGIALVLAGWYFAWNFALYGQPILMQNEIVSAHMAKSGYGPSRELSRYLSLDPEILTLRLELLMPANQAKASPAVWPVTFASVWFDLYSTVLLAPSRAGRLAAWILYACGALFTLLAAVGGVALLRAPRGSGRFVAGAALLGVIALALLAYGVFTWRVATFSALKGSYLSPSLLPFCVLAGAGCERLLALGRVARAALVGLLAIFVATATAIFWVGWLAPLPFNPGTFYLRAYSDAATERVYDFFVGGDPQARGAR